MKEFALNSWLPILAALEKRMAEDDRRWLAGRLSLVPDRWAAQIGAEHARRGGVASAEGNRWLLAATEAGERRRVPLSATDDDLRAAAVEAAREASGLIGSGIPMSDPIGAEVLGGLLRSVCISWGVAMPAGSGLSMPAVRRLVCQRWWLRRLRRGHGRAAEGAAIRGGVVRRGLWPYASQDAVERRVAQRERNGRALEKAVIHCDESGELVPLAEVAAGSLANPEVRRSELMVRIRGCDAIAHDDGMACEFWTLTTPSRFHAQRTVAGAGRKTEANPAYKGETPKEAHAYLCNLWARARAAWGRVGLSVYGLRTAEPHADGCPHWHLIVYGPAADLRVARWILRRCALQDDGGEPGARKHRFAFLPAKKGRYGAAYAAKYISKNINGSGMGNAKDGEAGRPVAESVRRVDAWASTWGIRQFQFFGCPAVSIWRVLRRLTGPAGDRGSLIERARCAADDSDFAEFWRCCKRGGLRLIYRAADRLTQYGDAAADRIAGVREGMRRALLPVKTWVIHWAGVAREAARGAFDFPWSGVNNCTRPRVPDRFGDAVGAIFSVSWPERRLIIDKK